MELDLPTTVLHTHPPNAAMWHIHPQKIHLQVLKNSCENCQIVYRSDVQLADKKYSALEIAK
jgi:hypothetical protein